MDQRHAIDGYCVAHDDAAPWVFECKGNPRRGRLTPVWFARPFFRAPSWMHLAPVGGVFVAGALVPGFLATLALLLLLTAGALGAFILFVQAPLGYLLWCWQGMRTRRAKELPNNAPR